MTYAKPTLDLHAFEAGTYLDQFATASYANSAGTVPWTSTWTEAGDRANSPETTGEIRISGGALEFRRDTGTAAGATITRSLDLSTAGAGSAKVSFNFVEANLDNGETVQVHYSSDGLTFSTVQTISRTSNTGSASITLNGVYSSSSAIRFVFSGVNATNETVRIDNVAISYTSPANDGLTSWQTTFTENGAAVGIASLSGIADAALINTARVVLTNAMAGDVLTATTENGLPTGIVVTQTIAAGNIVLDFSGAGTAADYQKAIDAVRFANTSEAPNVADRIINVTVNNGIADSDIAVSTIHVISVDDPMVANNDAIVTNYAANTAFTVKIADLLANDTDLDGAVAITAVTAQTGLASLPVLNTSLGTISVTDNNSTFGTNNFTYRGTGTDTATASVTRDNSGSLDGSGNADLIIADGANTTIIGNGGRDVMYGGAGNDTFDFNSLSDVATIGPVRGANVGQLEIIMDWNQGDRIDLSTIDARSGFGNVGNQAFAYLGAADFTTANANGGLHVFDVTDSGGQVYTVIEASTDTDTAAEFQLALLDHHTLNAVDFIL